MRQLNHNEASNQFETEVDGQVSFIEYFLEGKKIYLTHTQVPETQRGNGIGTELVELALGYIKKHHLILMPQCAFVSAYVDNHPEWHSILSEGYQM